jgi:hypothetical protein
MHEQMQVQKQKSIATLIAIVCSIAKLLVQVHLNGVFVA